MWGTIALLLLPVYILVDIHYFLRTVITYIICKYFLPKISLQNSSTLYGVTLFSDIDFGLDHMNNARLLREFDFARIGHGVRLGVFERVYKNGGGFPLSANFIRYRLPIQIFSLYKIETRIKYWTSKYMFIEQKLITVGDGITRAVAYPKIWFIHFNGDEILKELFPHIKSPALDTSMEYINNICDFTSEKLKAK